MDDGLKPVVTLGRLKLFKYIRKWTMVAADAVVLGMLVQQASYEEFQGSPLV